MKKILITGIGGPTPRSIAKTIRKMHPETYIVGIDCNPKAIGFFIDGLVDKYLVAPKVTDENYWEFINNLVFNEAIDFAFVQPEKEVVAWGQMFADEKKLPCPVLIPPIEHSKLLINKAEMATFLSETDYIPKTIKITSQNPDYEFIESEVGYPCWIRASVGSGGLGSLKLNRIDELKAWLFIHSNIEEFTVSEYLCGRHLANQMLYINGKCIKNAGLHCAEYVMADIAPSKVTGNTSLGLFINEKKLLRFCEEVMDFIQMKSNVKANGVYSFDLKEDYLGNLKVTEINIRHMAYTGIMALVGFDLVSDTIKLLGGNSSLIDSGDFIFDETLCFLRDVDVEPIIVTKDFFLNTK
jgi:hypothetical protein